MIVLTSNGASSTDNFFETAAVSVNGTDYLTPTPGSTTPSGVTIAGTTVTLTGTDEFGNGQRDDDDQRQRPLQLHRPEPEQQQRLHGHRDAAGQRQPPGPDLDHLGRRDQTPPGTPAVVSNIVLTTNGASSTDNFFETAAVSVNGTDYLTPTPGSTTPVHA